MGTTTAIAFRSGVLLMALLSLGVPRAPAQQSESPDTLLPLNVLKHERSFTSLKEALVHPEQVRKLSLANDELTYFPKEILLLPNLQWLNLSGNRISRLPPEISRLTELQVLNLFNNRLERLPMSLGELTHLKKLYLSANRLHQLPASIQSLDQLYYLDLTGNGFSRYQIRQYRLLLPAVTIDY